MKTASDEPLFLDTNRCKSSGLDREHGKCQPHSPFERIDALVEAERICKKLDDPRDRVAGPAPTFADPELNALVQEVWQEIVEGEYLPFGELLKRFAASHPEKD